MSSRFTIAPARAAAIGSLVAIFAGAIVASRSSRPMRAYVRAEVPEAAALLDRSDFTRAPDGTASNAAALGGDATGAQIVATAPSSAAQPFHLRARGGSTSVDVGLVGASASALRVEDGVAVYRDAYRNVDVVAVSGQERFELLYVAHDLGAASDLRVHVGGGEGDSLREEPSSHAMLLVGATGRPRARVARPTAIDARGERRAGTYRVEGGDLRIAIDTRGLRAPIVVDPAITLPLWSIVRDGRAPGQAVYDATLLSREAHLAFDSARGRTVLVRPVRSQQDVDTTFIFGNAANGPDFPSRSILPTPRTPGSTGVTPSAAVLGEWKRGWDLESETWEWAAGGWSLVDSAQLPGLVDPSLSYDASRARTVLYGGAAAAKLGCSLPGINFNTNIYCAADESDATATYEYDGSTWNVKRIAGAPPPRLRGAMAFLPAIGKTVLFGGRAFGSIGQVVADPRGAPFPENLAGSLLDDTWTFDGAAWERVATGSPPTPREGAQLVLDAARGVLVLVGGHSADDVTGESDPLAIWEFDGVDWSKKLAVGDSGQPASIATRRGASAFYNPIRKRVTVMGGTVKKLDFCALSDAQIAQQVAATQNDPAGRLALQATGCLGGFVHDAWEWDGATLSKTTDVVFGGVVGGTPVFRQVSGGAPWATAGAAPDAGAGPSPTTPLLPYRYDGRPDHFALRTELERAHYTAPPVDAGAPPAPTTAPTGAPASPLFAARVRPEIVFDASRGVATLFASDAVYDTDGATWTDRSPPPSPFATGANDFVASTWDSAAQRIVAFDPRDASTWALTDNGGWTKLAAANPPATWTVDPSVRTKREFARTQLEKNYGNEAAAFAAAQQQMPKMTFDRARGRTVMLYAGATWEFDGAAWTRAALPPTWTHCTAATLVAFDGARARTVAFGCNVPGETWEWDGATWTGPGPSPFVALVERNMGGVVQSGQPDWFGTMQLAWAHPNAAFESATLGGVSTLDADGTTRTWNGTAWIAGPKVASGMTCLASSGGGSALQTGTLPFPKNTQYWLGVELVPTCAQPPAFEDAAHGRVVALRDGPRGMLELPVAGVAPADRAWRLMALGTEGVAPNNPNVAGSVQVNPYPFELMSAENVHQWMQSDPASRNGYFGWGNTASNPPERVVQNLWWPYRVFVDGASKRVRVLTNRGALWELGGEVIHGLGDACASNLDCGDGACVDGVCCDNAACGGQLCMTCRGAHPGKCEPVAAGAPDPHGACGAGDCAGTCPGTANATACVFDATRSCGSAPVCSGDRYQTRGKCSATGATCVAAVEQKASACTVPTCDSQSVTLARAAAGSLCGDNADRCQGTSTCDATGACNRGPAPTIDTSNPCRVGHCDPATGNVTYTVLAAGAQCGDNSNKCLGIATCDASGACVRGAPVAIDTSNACRVGTCDPATGNVSYTTTAAGASCGPSVNGCAATSTCNATGACVSAGGPAVDTSNTCRVPTCNVGAGTVTYTTLPAGSACGDTSNKCAPSACDANGACVTAPPPAIDTSNPCRVGRCDPATGNVSYSFAKKGTACADNSNLCAAASTCDGAGACVVGPAPAVDDGDSCTTDRCDPAVGPAHDLIAGCRRIPPDPSTVATPIDPTIATDIASAYAFLYTGANPIQTGVAPGAIDPTRIAIVRGVIQTRDGAPLPGARINVYGHPELGQTLSRADGAFTMAINGGAPLTIDVTLWGYLPSQRRVTSGWREHVDVPTIALVAYDPQVTEIHPAAGAVARGSVTTDAWGSRQATAIFPQGTQLTMRLPDGRTRDLTKVRFRATEFTVGPNGPQAMPGSLPGESAYTYAVAFDFDEAVAAGAKTVEFDRPVPIYVENFLHFRAGTIVPSGYYDRDAGVWRATEDGVALTVLGVAGGIASIDADGDGVADDDATLQRRGITSMERTQVASLYSAGASLWRVPLRHFSNEDFNMPAVVPDDATAWSRPKKKLKPDCDETQVGSIIGCSTQSLGEEIGVTGTSQRLRYASDRVSGRGADFRVTIPLAAPAMPRSAKRIELEVHIAGRMTTQTFNVNAVSTEFVWDGKDAEGRTLRGEHPAHVRVGYVYDGVYTTPTRVPGPDYDQTFGHFSYFGAPATTDPTRQEITLWGDETYWLGVGNFEPLGASGWSVTSHHVLDPNAHVVHRGDGSRLGATTLGTAVRKQSPVTINPCAVAAAGDGSVYVAARASTGNASDRIVRVRPDGSSWIVWESAIPVWNDTCSIAVGPEGSVYTALNYQSKVIRIDPGGLAYTFAGTGQLGSVGEGQYAVDAQLNYPQLVAVGRDGTVYIYETDTDAPHATAERLLKVGPTGILTRVNASSLTNRPANDDGPVAQAWIGAHVTAMAVAGDGSVFFIDPAPTANDNDRLRRVRTGGTVETVASTLGTAIWQTAPIHAPWRLGTSFDGAVLVCDYTRVLKYRPDGAFETVWGDDAYLLGRTGMGAPNIARCRAGIAGTPDGNIAMAEDALYTVVSSLPGYSLSESVVPEIDGSVAYVFDGTGRHLRTIDTGTSSVLAGFAYDSNGYLASITDTDGDVMSFRRGAGGVLTAIDAPFGQRTVVTVTGSALLAATDPAGGVVNLHYGTGSLLDTFVDAKAEVHRFEYDALGRLFRDTHPAGLTKTLVRSDDADGWNVALSTTLGRTATYRQATLATGDLQTSKTGADGLTSTTVRKADNTAATVTSPDGTTITQQYGSDPRFGMSVPFLNRGEVRLPSGLTAVTQANRAVTLADPNNPLSVKTVTDVVDVNGVQSNSTVDFVNRTVNVSAGGLYAIGSVFDAKGRTTAVSVPGLAPMTYGYDAHGRASQITFGARTATIAYDAAGNVSIVTDPMGRVTTFGFDALGRPTRVTLPDARFATASYDPNSNLTSLTPPSRPAHTFTFLPGDRPGTYVPPAAPGTGTNTTTYSYDGDLAIQTVTMPDGSTMTIARDSAGRLASLTTPVGATTVTYDPSSGHVATIAAPSGPTLAFAFDGPLVKDTTWSGVIAGSLHREYDANFRVVSDAVNGGAPIAYGYNGAGVLLSAGAATLTRDPLNGMLLGLTVGGTKDERTYSPYAEPQSYIASYGSRTLLVESYVRDPLGRITEKVETVDGAAHTYDYAYDLAGRLVEVKTDGVVTGSYGYDGNGNRTSATVRGVASSATFDDQDRLIGYGGAAFTYDANGTLKTRVENGQTTTYDYDVQGNLRRATLPSGHVVEYVIDGANRRVGKRVDGTLVQGLLYANALKPIAELDGAGNVVSRFVYASNPLVADYLVKSGVLYRILSDQLGSPRLVVNAATGSVAQRLDFDEWGNVTRDTSPGFQPFGFAGGIYDRDTGLVRYGARDYDATVGRWTSKDPSGLAGGVNLYKYANNDPVNYVDPNGRVAVIVYVIAAAVIAAFAVDTDTNATTMAAGAPLAAAVGEAGLVADTALELAIQLWGVIQRHKLLADFMVAIGGSTYICRNNNAMRQVSRWGRPGLQPGDWIMKGPPSRWNYFKSGKWQPGFGNQFAPFNSAETFEVPESSIQSPTGWGPDGWVKSIFGQAIYKPE